MKDSIIVAFGGQSLEHDVSVITAMQAIAQLKRKYDIFPLYITKEGEGYIDKGLTNTNSVVDFIPRKRKKVSFSLGNNEIYIGRKRLNCQFVLNCLHGGCGENGSFAGLLNMIKVPYSSADVLGASASMDKNVQKVIAKSCGVDVLSYVFIDDVNKLKDFDDEIQAFGDVVVKPNNLGSSIGLSVCKTKVEIEEGVALAFMLDSSVLIEKKAENFFEINISAVKYKNNIMVSAIEKPKRINEVLTFEDKYLRGGKQSKGMKSLERAIIDDVSSEIIVKVKDYAQTLYDALNLFGICRFDFIVEDNVVYFNEVNTVPGSLSYYLWEEVGVNFQDLIANVASEGVQRQIARGSLITKIDTQVLKKR